MKPPETERPTFEVLTETDCSKNLGYLDSFQVPAGVEVARALSDAGAEIDRLQRRVEELEGALKQMRDERDRAESCEAARLAEAADWQKRAEDAAAGWRAHILGCAVAIEKARQEEREKLAAVLGDIATACEAKELRDGYANWKTSALRRTEALNYVHAAAIRALKSTKDPAIPVQVSASLPDGVAEFRDASGKVLLRVENIGEEKKR